MSRSHHGAFCLFEFRQCTDCSRLVICTVAAIWSIADFESVPVSWSRSSSGTGVPISLQSRMYSAWTSAVRPPGTCVSSISHSNSIVRSGSSPACLILHSRCWLTSSRDSLLSVVSKFSCGVSTSPSSSINWFCPGVIGSQIATAIASFSERASSAVRARTSLHIGFRQFLAALFRVRLVFICSRQAFTGFRLGARRVPGRSCP